MKMKNSTIHITDNRLLKLAGPKVEITFATFDDGWSDLRYQLYLLLMYTVLTI